MACMTARRALTRLRLVVLLTGLAQVATPIAIASADDGEPQQAASDKAATDRRARREFELGRQAYEGGDYRLAWEHFRQAYLLSKRPQLLYNVGQAADRMGQDEDALKAFRMYLDQMPTADNRREVENRVRALEQRVKAADMTPAPPPGNSWADPSKPAETSEPETVAESETPPPPDPNQPARSGWYFRGALGLGVILDSVSRDSTNGTVVAACGTIDVAAGYAVIDGLVVGGAVMGDLSPGGSQSEDGSDAVDLSGVTLWMLGPMADWYLSPHQDGFHVQGALMLASLSIDQPAAGTTFGLKTANGGALVLGTGYEFPFTQDLAWGLLGRASFARLSESNNAHSLFSLALMGSVTWY